MTKRSSIALTFYEGNNASMDPAAAADTTVAAGVVVDWIDKTAYACAASWAQQQCVTSYVGNMHFTVAVPRNTTVTVQARVVHTSASSIHVHTRVLIRTAEGGWQTCTECFMVYVALDTNGRPKPVPPFTPRTELEKRRDVDASRRMTFRRQVEETIQSLPDKIGTSESLTMRFLAETEDRYPDGRIRGGAVMKWIDLAAEICAERYCGHDVASVLTGGVRFYHSIRVGDLVEIDARLVLTGSKSMHILVRVRAGDRWERYPDIVAYGLPVMVAPDGQGTARRITRWEPVSEEDQEVAEKAKNLRDLRNATLLTPSPYSGPDGGVVRAKNLPSPETTRLEAGENDPSSKNA